MTASPLPILVADQEDESRHRLLEALRGGGFDPLAARTGGEAVEVVSRRVVPITILDVQLPDLSGIETFRRITSLREGVLGIFLVRERSRDTLVRLLEAGAYSVFQKPPGLKALLAMVRGAAFRIGIEDQT